MVSRNSLTRIIEVSRIVFRMSRLTIEYSSDNSVFVLLRRAFFGDSDSVNCVDGSTDSVRVLFVSCVTTGGTYARCCWARSFSFFVFFGIPQKGCAHERSIGSV